MSTLDQCKLLSDDIDLSYKSYGCLKSENTNYDSISPEDYLKKRPKWIPSFLLTKTDASVCKTNSFPFCTSMDVETSNRYSAQYIALHNFSKHSHSGSIYHSISTCAVLVIGAGGLGSPVLMYLASSGVGLIGIMDGDVVEVSNLHRQIIHDECYLGVNKARSARDRLGKYIAYEFYFGVQEAHEILPLYDVIVDASDNPQTKYLINDACILYNKPYVIASCIKAQGQLMVFNRLRLKMKEENKENNNKDNNNNEKEENKKEKEKESNKEKETENKKEDKEKRKMPCFRCICPDEGNPSISFVKNACSAAGVLGSIPGILGTIQATEVLKLCAGTFDTSLSPGRLLMYDALNPVNPFRTLELSRNRNCTVCGDNVKAVSLKMYETVEMTSNLDRDYLAINQDEFWKVYMEQLPKGLPVSEKLKITDIEIVLDNNGEEYLVYLIDVRPSPHYYICHLPGSVSWPLDDILNSTLTPKTFIKKLEKFTNFNNNNNNNNKEKENRNTNNNKENKKNKEKETENNKREDNNRNTNNNEKEKEYNKEKESNKENNMLLLTICRRGNASRVAADAIRNFISQNENFNKIQCYSVAGGMHYLNTHLKLRIPKT